MFKGNLRCCFKKGILHIKGKGEGGVTEVEEWGVTRDGESKERAQAELGLLTKG